MKYYNSEQAGEIDVFIDITGFNKSWKKHIFKDISLAILSKGYIHDGKINRLNLLDLLNQCLFIIQKKSNNFTKMKSAYTGKIELPNGEMQEVFMEQNETGKFTIMLPKS